MKPFVSASTRITWISAMAAVGWVLIGTGLRPGWSVEVEGGAEGPAAAAYTGHLYPAPVGGKWGYIDQRGEMVIEPRFDYASIFGDDGLAVVFHGFANENEFELDLGRMNIIDRHGEVVLDVPLAPIDLSGLRDEPAWARTLLRWLVTGNTTQPLGQGRFAILDGESMRFVGLIKPFEPELEVDMLFGFFKEGMVPVQIDGKWGYMNELGELAIEAKFDLALEFSEGLAHARAEDERWGYIDHSGQWTIEPEFFSLRPFSEGLAVASIGEPSHTISYYIDRSGRRAIDREFALAYPFSEGLAAVREAAREEDAELAMYGYIDHTGEYRIPPQFRRAGSFENGLAPVQSEDGTRGYIDHSGRFVITLPPGAHQHEPFQNGLAFVQLEETVGYINRAGEWIWSERLELEPER